MEEQKTVDHSLSRDQQMVPLLKLSNVKRQAWAYYYALAFSWIYTIVIMNFARMNWNFTVSHSGH